MSDLFHKSFYTTRSAGYKYRTLATNTNVKFGDLKLRHVNIWDKKIEELKKAILMKVNKEVSMAEEIRDNFRKKLEKIDAKVDTMLELQNTILSLRKDLTAAEANLLLLLDKVDRLDAISMANSFQSRNTYMNETPLAEMDEISIATYMPTPS